MVKVLKCEDMNPGCNFEALGNTDEEVLRNAARHAKVVHNVKEISPEHLSQARRAIRDEDESRQYASGSN